MNRFFAVGSSISALSIALLAACVGDGPRVNGGEPGGGSSGTSGASGTNDGGGTSGQPGCAGDSVDACGAACAKCVAPASGAVSCVSGACQKTCSDGLTLCGDTCVDTQGSGTQCGACGHSCGGGQCSGGLCQPFPAASGFTAVHAIAASPSGIIISADNDVSLCANPSGCSAATLKTIKAGVSQLNDVTVAGTDVYFDGNVGDSEIVYRCPIAGCPGTGPTIVENIINDGIGRVVAGPKDVLWTRYGTVGNYGPYSRRCALPGCASNVDVRLKGAVDYSANPAREQSVPSKIVSVGAVSTLWATGSLYNDPQKQLRACPLASTCAVPVEIDTGAAGVSALTYFDGKHYGASGASGGGSVVFSLSDAAPGAGARALLVSDAAGIADVAVDASGIYWVNAVTGKVLRCAKLTGCSGSGETLATGQTGAIRIRLDAKFVYWMTTTSVMKVAK